MLSMLLLLAAPVPTISPELAIVRVCYGMELQRIGTFGGSDQEIIRAVRSPCFEQERKYLDAEIEALLRENPRMTRLAAARSVHGEKGSALTAYIEQAIANARKAGR